ncbi:MAG: hypothetical protein LUI02_06290 [Clostridiales bacterium]|nr:hypothetical protein [Clostridiales bacterium]
MIKPAATAANTLAYLILRDMGGGFLDRGSDAYEDIAGKLKLFVGGLQKDLGNIDDPEAKDDLETFFGGIIEELLAGPYMNQTAAQFTEGLRTYFAEVLEIENFGRVLNFFGDAYIQAQVELDEEAAKEGDYE